MNQVNENIILVGGGGHCHSVIDVIEQQGIYQIVGIVDVKEHIGTYVLGYPVIASDEQLLELFQIYKNALVTVGHIKSNRLRLKLYKELKRIGYTLPTIISPFAYVSQHAAVGEGTIVMHHALVNAKAQIGDNCIINTKVLVEHDAIVENHCHIATASVINGGVIVKENTFVGSNATSSQYVTLEGFVKAGSVAK